MFRLQRVEGNCYDPSLQPEKILLKPTVTRLGRNNEYSDVVIDSVISLLMISLVHAEIQFNNGKFRIDCKGLNGLLVNKTKRSSAVLNAMVMLLSLEVLALKRKKDRVCQLTIRSL